MLRARTNTGVFILGLDAENLRRLRVGQPILVSLAEMGGTDDILIMADETLDDIRNTLESACGQFPEPTPLDESGNTQ